MPLAQVVKYYAHGKEYYGYHYGDRFNFTNEIELYDLLRELRLDGIVYKSDVLEINLKTVREDYRRSLSYCKYKDQLITKYQIYNYLINRCNKTKSLLDALFLNVTQLEVEVTLLRYEYEQLINEISDELQCFYYSHVLCTKKCPDFRYCEYYVKEVK
jgi:hypothetical protein